LNFENIEGHARYKIHSERGVERVENVLKSEKK
jgi:hypothetical protein